MAHFNAKIDAYWDPNLSHQFSTPYDSLAMDDFVKKNYIVIVKIGGKPLLWRLGLQFLNSGLGLS